MLIKNTNQLKNQINKFADEGKTIGAISGSFDGLHDGHKYALEFCSKKVDRLIVLVNSDESIKTYKGNERPINTLGKRLEKLEKFSKTFYYVTFNDLIPNNKLEIIKPNYYFLSPEWVDNPVEKPVLLKNKTTIVKHPVIDNLSTSLMNDDLDKSIGAIFLDRDGTINIDSGFIDEINKIKIPEKNLKAIKHLSSLGYLNIIITNQSGVGYNYFSLSTMKKINNRVTDLIVENGGRIDKVYFDTSTKENPSELRKPNLGMIMQARKDFNISLKNSWVIGDKDSDIELGKKSNMRSIYIVNKNYKYTSSFDPDFKVMNLYEAYEIIKSFSIKNS